MLVARFGILWRPTSTRLDTAVDVVRACMRIHNLCIDEKDNVPTSAFEGSMDPESHAGGALAYATTDVFDHQDERGRRRDLEGFDRRKYVTRELRGRVRPTHSGWGRTVVRARR